MARHAAPAMIDVQAPRPEPPYWAVVFTRIRREPGSGFARTGEGGAPAAEAGDAAAPHVAVPDYDALADRMLALARSRPGFLGVDSVSGPDGHGITVSYWATEEALRGWREHAEHAVARRFGREAFYAYWRVRVARVERDYASDGGRTPDHSSS